MRALVVVLLATLCLALHARPALAGAWHNRYLRHQNATFEPHGIGRQLLASESCKTSKDCTKPKICVEGTCTCPVLYRGNDTTCAPTVLPDSTSDWCVMPVNSEVFRKYAKGKYDENKRKRKRNFWNPDNAQWKFFGDATQSKVSRPGGREDACGRAHELTDRPPSTRLLLLQTTGEKNYERRGTHAHTHTHTQLSKFRDNNAFAKCAVVGSSNSLTKREQGELIDSHGVVIRFNAAPTRGFQKYVGKRTTLRVQNIRYCGSSSRDEHCIHYSRNQDPKSHQCKRWRRCKRVNLHNQVVEYIQHYWRIVPNPPGIKDRGKSDAKLSAGFFGIVLAMHVCAEVNIFGFSQGERHYYKKGDKKFMKGKPFYKRHRWLWESACMNKLREGAYPGVKVYN